MKEEKLERKHAKQILERENKAAAVQKLLPVAVQLTAQYVRSVRSGIMGQKPVRANLESLRMAKQVSQ